MAYNYYENIPDELKRLPNWVCWQASPDPSSHSGIKKEPINPHTGGRAMSNNPQTWSDFDTAVKRSADFTGIGFMFGGSGYLGVDLDDMPDDLSDYLNGGTNNIVSEFVNGLKSYAELSQSGTGIHIIGRGKLPKGGRRKKHACGGFEMYDSGRFFVMTGKSCSPYTEIADCTETIKSLHKKYICTQEQPKPRTSTAKAAFSPTANEILSLAQNAKNGAAFSRLYSGDISGYGSHSEADLALCNMLAFWCGGDGAKVDELFRQSGLMRPKWDKKRGEQTYGQMTVNAALASCTEVYSPAYGQDKAMLSFTNSIAAKRNADDKPAKSELKLPDFTYDDMKRHKADDIGTAEFFGGLVRGFMCYVPEYKTFFIYNGVMWEQDTKENLTAGRIMMKFTAAAQALIPPKPAGAPTEWTDEQARKENINAAYRRQYTSMSRTTNRGNLMNDVKKLIKKPAAIFDTQPNLLNTQNCTYNLKTHTTQPHRAEDYLTMCTDAPYDPNAESKLFNKTLYEICEGDGEKMKQFQVALGYSLLGAAPEECLFIAYGSTTRNGKGTLFDLTKEILGDYAAQIDFDVIARSNASKDSSRATPEIARLRGKRFVTANEPQKGVCFNEGLVKQLTGNDNVVCRPLYGEPFEYKPQFKIFIQSNNLPQVSDDTLFISDRIRLLMFNRHFSENERDTRLKIKLRQGNGKAAMLKWLIDGYKLYTEHGLIETAESKKVLRQYQKDNDYIAEFMNEVLDIDPQCKPLKLTAVQRQYNDWCRGSNIKPLGKRNFTEELEKHGLELFEYSKQKCLRAKIKDSWAVKIS